MIIVEQILSKCLSIVFIATKIKNNDFEDDCFGGANATINSRMVNYCNNRAIGDAFI